VDPELGEPSRDAVADAPQCRRRAVAHHLHPVVPGQPVDAARLAELGRDLGADLGVTDADRAVQPGGVQHRGLQRACRGLRVVAVDADERLVPAEQLTTVPGKVRSVSMTWADAASYTGKSTGRNTASGHLRTAVFKGIPERIPNWRAS
jgi:hypothetical protein